MPAMQIHLIEFKSSVGALSRSFSSHKFQVYMMVLSELRENYWGAEVAYGLFEQAEAKLNNRSENHQTKATISDKLTSDNVGNPTTDIPPLTPESASLSNSQTQPALSEDYLFDPENFLLDQFTLGSMVDTEAYHGFDSAAVLETRDFRPGYSGRLWASQDDQSLLIENNNGRTDLMVDFGPNSG